MAPDKRKDYDAALERITSFVPGEKPAERVARRRVPKWYKGPEAAVANSMLAARQLGVRAVE